MAAGATHKNRAARRALEANDKTAGYRRLVQTQDVALGVRNRILQRLDPYLTPSERAELGQIKETR